MGRASSKLYHSLSAYRSMKHGHFSTRSKRMFPPRRVRLNALAIFGRRLGLMPTASVEGHPDPKYVSTSFAERQNPSMQLGNGRMTRLPNALSKSDMVKVPENWKERRGELFMQFRDSLAYIHGLLGRSKTLACFARNIRNQSRGFR